MKRNAIFASALLCAILPALVFTSCKKDKDEEPAPNPGNGNTNTTLSYSFPMTTGSYWIYQNEKTDSLGNVTDVGEIDSIYVAGDSVIGSNTFKKFLCSRGPGNEYFPVFFGQPVKLYRDSAGYIVEPDGSFIEYNNFTDTLLHSLNAGLIDSYYMMSSPDSMLVTPAGTFQTVDYHGTHYFTDPNYPHPNPRYTHQFLGNGVGLVYQTSFYSSVPWYVQLRLIRYHIQ